MVAGAVFAVSVDPANDVPFGPPVQILDGPFAHYDVAPDGRFLAIRQRDATVDGVRDRIIVVQNWFDELKRLVPP
ncbi:MAG TPA: hypothetical protein VMM79_08545 [Longimicrobiales bacterium]|nr:hypothetical protein [Longimicrobiales bacterium]